MTREMSVYVTEAFYAYEAVRDARDEALVRVQELTDERNRLRDLAVALEQDGAAWRRVALAWDALSTDAWCPHQDDAGVQCSLPKGHSGGCVFIGLLP